MLTICLTKNALNFEDLTDELYQTLTQKYHLDLISNETEHSYFIEDKPEYLYKLLHKLTYEFDITLT